LLEESLLNIAGTEEDDSVLIRQIEPQPGGGNCVVDSNVYAAWLTTGFSEVNAGDGDNTINLNVGSAVPARTSPSAALETT